MSNLAGNSESERDRQRIFHEGDAEIRIVLEEVFSSVVSAICARQGAGASQKCTFFGRLPGKKAYGGTTGSARDDARGQRTRADAIGSKGKLVGEQLRGGEFDHLLRDRTAYHRS